MKEGKEFEKFAVKHMGINSAHVDQFQKLVTRDPQLLTPYILEERQMHVTQMDVFSRLMRDRILFFNETVTSETMGIMKAQLLFLDSTSESDINMYIDSGGGGVYAGLSLIDTMDLIKCDTSTIVNGIAASMGAVILTAGKKGKRFGLKHSRVMIHQPLGNPGYSQFSDLEINLIEMAELKKELYTILAERSGQTYDQIHTWCDRDHWMKADLATERGFIDGVVKK